MKYLYTDRYVGNRRSNRVDEFVGNGERERGRDFVRKGREKGKRKDPVVVYIHREERVAPGPLQRALRRF